MVQIIGMDMNAVTNWEKGRTKPCRKNLAKVMDFMEIEESKRKNIEPVNNQKKTYSCT